MNDVWNNPEFKEYLKDLKESGYDAELTENDIVMIQEAWGYMVGARREIVVLTSQMNSITREISQHVLNLMENPMLNREIIFSAIENLQKTAALLDDKIMNFNWDVEFYKWWLDEIRMGNVEVIETDPDEELLAAMKAESSWVAGELES